MISELEDMQEAARKHLLSHTPAILLGGIRNCLMLIIYCATNVVLFLKDHESPGDRRASPVHPQQTKG